MEAVTLKELARQEKIPYSTVAGWIERGLVEPIRRTGKSGAAVVLDGKNVVELKNLISLRKGGLSLQRARHLIEDLQAAGYNPLSRGVFVVLDRKKGRVVRISENRATAQEVMGPNKGQYVMVEIVVAA
jgi:DNA-binding transcriptional MerR regulator